MTHSTVIRFSFYDEPGRRVLSLVVVADGSVLRRLNRYLGKTNIGSWSVQEAGEVRPLDPMELRPRNSNSSRSLVGSVDSLVEQGNNREEYKWPRET